MPRSLLLSRFIFRLNSGVVAAVVLGMLYTSAFPDGYFLWRFIALILATSLVCRNLWKYSELKAQE